VVAPCRPDSETPEGHAGWAGSIVGGALSSGFDEQPVTKASKSAMPENGVEMLFNRSQQRLALIVEHEAQFVRNVIAPNIVMLHTHGRAGEYGRDMTVTADRHTADKEFAIEDMCAGIFASGTDKWEMDAVFPPH